MFEQVQTSWQWIEATLSGHPVWFFWALVVLPGLPVPTSALLVLAGLVWNGEPIMAGGLCVLAMALNMSWGYWVAAGPGRIVAEWLLRRWNVKVPDGAKRGVEMVLLFRLTPGMPFFVQNYALGFMRVPFRKYLPLSLLCSTPIVVGVVLSGAGLVGGNMKPLIAGVGLLVVAGIAVKWLRNKMKSEKSASSLR